MKYLLLFILMGCSGFTEEKVADRQPVKELTLSDRVLGCIDKYLKKDVGIEKAHIVCSSVIKRK